MTEPEYVNGLNRVGMMDFLNELDVAKDWMLWVSPTLSEIELFVKGEDDLMRAYHGPEPMEIEAEIYKKFLKDAEEMADKKTTEGGEEGGKA